MIWILTLACSKDEAPNGDGPGDSVVATDSPVDSPTDSPVDTGEPIEWKALTGTCEAPSDLGQDPLSLHGELKLTQETPGGGWFVELVDLEVSGDRIYGAGQGGLTIYDISEGGNPKNPGHYPPGDSTHGRYHRVEVLSEGIVAAAHRDQSLEILNLVDPEDPSKLFELGEKGIEGLALVDGRLYASKRDGTLIVMDPSTYAMTSHTGFGTNTWELAKSDGWLYAADSSGLIPISLADPDAPVAQPTVELSSVLHASVDGDYVYVAQGSLGVSVLSLATPEAPTLVTTIPVSGSAVQVSAGEGTLWIADHEGLASWDITDPTNPTPTGHEVSEQFALAVTHKGERGWLGDWNILSGWDLEPGAPELDIARSHIELPADGGSQVIDFRNWGASELELTGVGEINGLTVEVSSLTLQPGETGKLRLTWAGGDLDGPLCISSNDADDPTRELIVVAGDGPGRLGQPATDFTLSDLDGNTYTLSDHVGQPVVMAYFATW